MRRFEPLVSGMLVVVAAAEGSVRGAVIGFDDLASAVFVTDQYLAQGVAFSGTLQIVGPGPSTNPVSGPNSVVFYNPQAITQPTTVTATFFVPGTSDPGTTDFVSFTPTDASDFSTQFSMLAYDAGGNVIGSASRAVDSTGTYNPAVDTPMSISIAGIARVELTGSVRPGANFVIEGDNFEFNTPVPAPGAAGLAALGLAVMSRRHRQR